MYVPKSTFEEHSTTYVFGSCIFLARPQTQSGCCTLQLLLWKNILNYFGYLEVRILVKK